MLSLRVVQPEGEHWSTNLQLTIISEADGIHPVPRSRQDIAAILSAYDDLIENNTRRIKILEEMATNDLP